MNWLDLFDDNAEADRARNREMARNELSEVCEDDCEATCPFVGMLPDESNKEEGSPLNFSNSIDREIEAAFIAGF